MGLFGHGWVQPRSPAMMSQLWAQAPRAVPRAVPSAVWFGPACVRLRMDPDPPGRCQQELVVAQMNGGGLGTPPAQHVPRRLPKVTRESVGQEPAPSLTHEPQAVSGVSPQPGGHGDGHPWGAWGTGATSPGGKEGKVCRHCCKAAPMPAQRDSPLPHCPQAPPPRSARLDWPLCPPTADTAPRGAVRCWGRGRGSPRVHIGQCHAPLLVPLAAPQLSPTREAPRCR